MQQFEVIRKLTNILMYVTHVTPDVYNAIESREEFDNFIAQAEKILGRAPSPNTVEECSICPHVKR